MANMYINAMTALWNSVGTLYSAIKMNVTNSGSAAGSRLIDLQVGSVDKFYADKDGNMYAAGAGTFLGTLTSGNAILPSVANTPALGSSVLPWADLYLGTGGVIDWAAGDVTLTHSADALTVALGDLRVTTAGITATSVVTTQATQPLTNKAISGSTFNGSIGTSTPSAGAFTSITATGNISGLTLQSLGAVSGLTGAFTTSVTSALFTGNLTGNVTGNINGTIGAITPATGTFTTLQVNSNLNPDAASGADLGTGSLGWNALYLGSLGFINWGAGDVTITHATDLLTFAGAASGYRFSHAISPTVSSGASLGSTTLPWLGAYFGSASVLDWAGGDITLTHTANILTLGGGDLRVSTAGTNSASVVTVDGVQSLTGKTLTSPTITTPTITTPTVTGTMTAAAITASGTVTATTLTATGNVNGTDFHAIRSAGQTGVIYLGNQAGGASYLYYDGTNYSMPGGALSVGGAIVAGGTLSGDRLYVNGGTASYIDMQDTDNGKRYIHNNSGYIGFLDSGGNWAARVNDSGQWWTSELGDLNTRIENRGQAWANYAIGQVPAAIAGITGGEVGAYGFFCRDGGGGAIAINGLIAGGSLAWTNVGTTLNGRPGGTWRCMGYVQSGATSTGATTMFQRAA